jgi:DNA polymerase III sliding clamp (beta) subunit (PCNA family)
MLKGKIDEKTITSFIDAVSIFVTECRLHINEKEIHTAAVNQSNVALAQVKLSKDGFSEYIVTPSEMCLDITKLKSALVCIRADEYSVLFTESSGKVEFSGNGYTYRMSLLADASLRKDPTSDPSQLPLPCHLQMSGKEFSNAITAIGKISDVITLKYIKDDGKLSIFSKDELENMTAEIDKNNFSAIKNVDAESMFATEFVKSIARIASNSDVINIHLGNNMPLRTSLQIGTKNPVIDATYVVAPRLE